MKELKRIHEEVENIINPVYSVGGCVRDSLLGKTPKDYDFATPLTPEEVEKKVKESINSKGHNRKAYTVGKRFGTIGFKLDSGKYVEVTTFRTEKYAKNNRKPNVEFVENIIEDLNRRDFGINAIAYRKGKLIDPSGGRVDILEKKIRSVGSPKARIKEDPLRMLRCARFSNQFNFEVDDHLRETIKKHSYKIMSISKERCVSEIDKILLCENPRKGLEFLAYTRILNFIIPELSLQIGYNQNSKYHDYTLWEHTLNVVCDVPKENLNLRWAALLHDIAKPFVRTEKKDRSNYIFHEMLGADIAEKTSRALKFSNERREYITEIIKHHLKENSELKKYDDLRKLGKSMFK